jgi:hypothetical protein
MMSRFRLLVGAMLALFAFGAFMAASASAVTFLLAEWLVGGVAVTTESLVEVGNEILLEDNKVPIIGKATILCSGFLDGWVGPASLDWVSEALSLNGEAISNTLEVGKSLDCVAQSGCETNTPVLVWPVGMPWTTEAELMEDGTEKFFADLIKSAAGGTSEIGWEIENCLVLGSAMTDKCTSVTGVAQLLLEGAVLHGIFSTAFTLLAELELATCEKGGVDSGVVEANGTYTASGELMPSSEGVE